MTSSQEAHVRPDVRPNETENHTQVDRTQFEGPAPQIHIAKGTINTMQSKDPEKTAHPATIARMPYVELRPFSHKYFIRRPRALQYFQDGNYVETLPSRHDSHQSGERANPEPNSSMWLTGDRRVPTSMIPLPSGSEAEIITTEEPILQRKRLDLFIDLLWVGIISNISESFTDAAFHEDSGYGIAFLEYLVLFFIAWQIWNYLRDLLNTFFTDDLLQRAVILWTLILALVYGNSASYFTDSQNTQEVIITIFLIARGTFAATEAVYLYFLPGLRRQFMYRFVFSAIIAGLFIGSIYVEWPANSSLYIAAIVLEMALLSFSNSPIQDRLLKGQHRKAPDPEHLIDRFESFFIIIVGEGVFLLIKNSPLGLGVTTQSSMGMMVLIIYYMVFAIYSASDQSKHYIHAVRRAWWSTSLWMIVHIWIFSSFLLCDASFLYLIENLIEEDSSNDTSETADIENTESKGTKDSRSALIAAKWTATTSLGIALFCFTAKDLLNKCLDRPGTLLIDNRYIRLAPRIILACILVCINIGDPLSPQSLISVVMSMIWVVGVWEWISGLEKGARLVEPKNPEAQ